MCELAVCMVGKVHFEFVLRQTAELRRAKSRAEWHERAASPALACLQLPSPTCPFSASMTPLLISHTTATFLFSFVTF